jgi:putative aminopeptidase FrvX
MKEITPFLKEMVSIAGLSGYETPIRQLIEETWRPLTDELHVSRLGSLHGLQMGEAPEESGSRPGIVFATHMDAIGLMVKGVVEGFLRVTEVGGIDPRVLPGQPVVVHGREDIPAVVVQPPANLLPKVGPDTPVSIEHLLVDTGLLPNQVSRLVRTGDLVSFAQEPLELSDDYLAGHTMDNRVSIAALTYSLELLRKNRHAWDVWAVATVQEEETMAGALTSAYDLRPKIAVAVDVTFAKGPGVSDYRAFSLGKGITLGWGPNIHPTLHKKVKELADKLEIPYHLEPLPHHSGTDAYGMQIAAEGIPTMVIGIPLRYMHTPIEMVAIKDIQRAGRLMAEFAMQLEPEFVVELTEK